MARLPNTDTSGSRYSAHVMLAVWRKGTAIQGYDPQLWRRDACGALMYWLSYGQQTQYGWEIDHIKPVAKGGGDQLENLQPLQWQNNRHKSDDYPRWTCRVSVK